VADKADTALQGEIDHLRRLARLVTDVQVIAEIHTMIEELEQRLRDRETRSRLQCIVEKLSASLKIRAPAFA